MLGDLVVLAAACQLDDDHRAWSDIANEEMRRFEYCVPHNSIDDSCIQSVTDVDHSASASPVQFIVGSNSSLTECVYTSSGMVVQRDRRVRESMRLLEYNYQKNIQSRCSDAEQDDAEQDDVPYITDSYCQFAMDSL